MPATTQRSKGLKRTRSQISNTGQQNNTKSSKRGKADDVSVSKKNAPCVVLTLGQGDTGQLGLGPDVLERRRPTKIEFLDDKKVCQVCAGGMHTLCATEDGKIYSFGCNDEGALGRDTSVEGSECTPGLIDLPDHIVQVCAGDSHSAALTKDGAVYIWGTFRNSNGGMGLLRHNEMEMYPVPLLKLPPISQIASGTNHLVCLSTTNDVYSLGCAEQGQLGRISQFRSDHTRRTSKSFLQPGLIRVKVGRKYLKFSHIWTGSYSTFFKELQTERIYACGLNNFSQLGFPHGCELTNFLPTVVDDLKNIEGISSGLHHTLAIDENGNVFSFGRHDFGMLGQPNASTEKLPTIISSITKQNCVKVCTGNDTSFVLTSTGNIYSFGMGVNLQLSTESEDPEAEILEPSPMIGKALENREPISISAGGQHTVILAKCFRTSEGNC